MKKIDLDKLIKTKNGITYIYLDPMIEDLIDLENKDYNLFMKNVCKLRDFVAESQLCAKLFNNKVVKETCRFPNNKKYYKEVILPIHNKLDEEIYQSMVEDIEAEGKSVTKEEIAAKIAERLTKKLTN